MIASVADEQKTIKRFPKRGKESQRADAARCHARVILETLREPSARMTGEERATAGLSGSMGITMR